jgi:hypothetical protein
MNPNLEQCKESLALANDTRSRRAALKELLRAGRVTPASVLRADKEFTRKMQLRELLLATPSLGRVKVDAMMERFDLRASIKLCCLSLQRRNQVIEWYEAWDAERRRVRQIKARSKVAA